MSEARGVAVMVTFAVLGACRPSGAPPVPAADSAPVATIDVADSASPDAAATASTSTSVGAPIASASGSAVAPDDAATANRPITPIAKLAKLTLEQSEGGPSVMRCNGLTYSVSVDLAKNVRTLRLDRTGASEKYVDENWGCKKPAPEIAKGVKDLATTMMLIVNAP